MVVELRQDQDLERLLERSTTEPVVIFKHSTQCPISAQAHQEFGAFTKTFRDVPCGIVLVIENRGLSNEIADRFGIRHESPQAFLIKDREVVWHASHWSITSDTLSDALKPYAQPANQRN